MLPLVLASSSPYRRELLARLQRPFSCSTPAIDETRHPDEDAATLVQRLAREKAQALQNSHPRHLIIGSDQVAVLDGQILGKPHTFERARDQLLAASGKSVIFLTGLALLNSENHHCQVDCISFTVHFRPLSEAQIPATCTQSNRTTALEASKPKASASAYSAAHKAPTPAA